VLCCVCEGGREAVCEGRAGGRDRREELERSRVGGVVPGVWEVESVVVVVMVRRRVFVLWCVVVAVLCVVFCLWSQQRCCLCVLLRCVLCCVCEVFVCEGGRESVCGGRAGVIVERRGVE